MFESIINFFKKFGKEDKEKNHSKDAAKERLHLVLMQDRANVSADFLDLMKQEIIEVIKKYIDVDENEIDVRLANKTNEDGTTGAPALYANIPIISIKEEAKKGVRQESNKDKDKDTKEELNENNKKEENIEENVEKNIEEKKEEIEDKKIEDNNVQKEDEDKTDKDQQAKEEVEENSKQEEDNSQKQEDKI